MIKIGKYWQWRMQIEIISNASEHARRSISARKCNEKTNAVVT